MSGCLADFHTRLVPASPQIRHIYFTNLDPDVILETIPDKACEVFLARPEEAATRIQQRVSSDEIPEGHEIMSRMCLQNLPCFDKKGQRAVTRLFNCLQEAHNYLAKVANQVIMVSEVSSPEQLYFCVTTCSLTPHPVKNTSTFVSPDRT